MDCFQEALKVSDMEYFMCSSIFRQFNVYKIFEKPNRVYHCSTLELLTFI